MLKNRCKTLGFNENMVYKILPGGGEKNLIQPVAYYAWYLARRLCRIGRRTSSFKHNNIFFNTGTILDTAYLFIY